MGTRALIIFKDQHSSVPLYKHWDGYPEFIIPYIKDFAVWYTNIVQKSSESYFPHFLYQAEDVAGAFIVFDWYNIISYWDMKKIYRRPTPDVRPININTNILQNEINRILIDYIYEVILRPSLTWEVNVYETEYKPNKEAPELIKINSIEINLTDYLTNEYKKAFITLLSLKMDI